MGSWNGTCAITNFPIASGEEIVLVILKPGYDHGAVGESGYVYSNGMFSPAFLPIFGKYDDYGGIEDIEKNFNTEIIEKWLQERYHAIRWDREKEDHKVYLETLLNGIERGKVEGLASPTPEQIENDKLARKALEVYGNDDKQVLEEWERFLVKDKSKKWRKISLSYCMIRRDVWDTLVNDMPNWDGYNISQRHGKDSMTIYEFVRHELAKNLDQYELIWANKEVEKLRRKDNRVPYKPSFVISSSFAGSDHLHAEVEYAAYVCQFEAGSEEYEDFVKRWFELQKVNAVMSRCRIGWNIHAGSGSQYFGWEDRKNFYQLMLPIIEKKEKEYTW